MVDFDEETRRKIDEDVAYGVRKAMEQNKNTMGKQRRRVLWPGILGLFFAVAGIVSLQLGPGIFLIIAAVMMFLYACCMGAIAKSNKKMVEEYEQEHNIVL